MAENRYTKLMRARNRNTMADVKTWRIVVYSGGTVILDRTVKDKEKARILWEQHRDGDCWTECYADGRKLRWVEAERTLMGYTHQLLGRSNE